MSTKNGKIKLGNMSLDVVRKDIKHVHLCVYPPNGRVRISVPARMQLDTVRVFAISKLSWIKKQQNRFIAQEREAPREFSSRESHYFLGKRHLLKVVEHDAPAKVEVKHDTIQLFVRPGTGMEKKQEILHAWYRKSLREIIPGIIARYEKAMNVTINDFGIKRMRTKWGTCSRAAKRIWLNLELAKKPLHFIEYVVVHEMAHLVERRHNGRFTACMNELMPQWRVYKEELNRALLGHVDWGY